MHSKENSAKKIITSYKKKLSNKNFQVTEPEQKQYHFEITVSDGLQKIKVLVYFGKKGNKTILQGNVDTKVYEQVNEIIFGEKFLGQDTQSFEEPENYIGTDESGKGDYFGPLVISGVYVNETTKKELKKLGVKDSKIINENNIKSLSFEIIKIVKNNFNIILISPAKYNELYKKFGNLNRLLGWAHAKVIENILDRQHADEVISDKFADESVIRNSLQKKGQNILLHQFTKAEKYTAVAAASILARNKFNEWFEIQNKNLGFILPKGASSKVEDAAIKIKKEHGEEMFGSLVKLHFKTTKKITTN
ncbi:MAG: ribonuclease HIII [Ignavibacteriaceae bacterium]